MGRRLGWHAEGESRPNAKSVPTLVGIDQQVLVAFRLLRPNHWNVRVQPSSDSSDGTGPDLAAMLAQARRLRAEKNLTLEVIAERAGMTVNGVGNRFAAHAAAHWSPGGVWPKASE